MSECRSVEQCRGSVGAVRGSVSVDTGRFTGVGVSSSVRAVPEQCRLVSGVLDVGHHRRWRQAVSECGHCRSVGVSECRRVEECRRVVTLAVELPRGVSECRSVRVSECQVGVRWVIVSSSDEMLWIWMSQ